MKKLFATTVPFFIMTAGLTQADPVGDLLGQVEKLDQTEVEGLDGHLFLGWLQMDDADPNFVVYVGNRRYTAVLDDGRSTTQRAEKCRKENIFDENPATGCPISFDAEYNVESNGGAIEASMQVWNVTFK